LQNDFETILRLYVNARSKDPFRRTHNLWPKFEAIRNDLLASDPVKSRPPLIVQWSAGQGNWARVPWIALMDKRGAKSIQEGVYCVYLFRQDMTGVYLTFNQGVTEPKKRLGTAGAYDELQSKARSIREKCSELTSQGFSLKDDIDLRAASGLGTDYERSTIAHKLYEAGQVPDDATLLRDVEAVLAAYDRYLQETPSPPPSPPAPPAPPAIRDRGDDLSLKALAETFHHDISDDAVGLRATEEAVVRLLASLLSKRFLMLSGLSGSGKTGLAQALARWLTRNPGWVDEADRSNGKRPNPYYVLMPVGADWTGNENILGYPDGLNPQSYVGTSVLGLIRHANRDQGSPHFLILDEMNLSHVERYFADVLSAIESGEDIPLYDAEVSDDGDKTFRGDIPDRLKLPENLFIIGTVNVDETTYMFSPKVLDRANVIEFKVEPGDFDAFVENPHATRLDELDGRGSRYAELFVAASAEKDISVPSEVKQQFGKEMSSFFQLLRPQFGVWLSSRA
jgi:5-methylcytosine-specific restriction protein B